MAGICDVPINPKAIENERILRIFPTIYFITDWS